MTIKERDQLSRDIQFRIMCLHDAEKVGGSLTLAASEVRLEVEHGILPIITRVMDKVVRRAQEGETELANGEGVWRRGVNDV